MRTGAVVLVAGLVLVSSWWYYGRRPGFIHAGERSHNAVRNWVDWLNS